MLEALRQHGTMTAFTPVHGYTRSFPKTTNQDFHNADVFLKMKAIENM